MAECLFIARKNPPAPQPRATFVVLAGQARNSLHGELVAQAVTNAISNRAIRRLEDGPFEGTRILLGDVLQGEALDCPLPDEGAWQMVGIKDITLGQTVRRQRF